MLISKGMLEVLTSESIFYIEDLLILREIIVKKSSSSKTNRKFMISHIHPAPDLASDRRIAIGKEYLFSKKISISYTGLSSKILFTRTKEDIIRQDDEGIWSEIGFNNSGRHSSRVKEFDGMVRLEVADCRLQVGSFQVLKFSSSQVFCFLFFLNKLSFRLQSPNLQTSLPSSQLTSFQLPNQFTSSPAHQHLKILLLKCGQCRLRKK